MNVHSPDEPMIEVPDARDGEAALAFARLLFQRSLASWASDLLLLQKRGINVPDWTGVDGALDLHRAA